VILWAKHGKHRALFSMFTLYINLKWKIRGGKDGRQVKSSQFIEEGVNSFFVF